MKWSDGEVTVREDGDRITIETDLPDVAQQIGDLLRRYGRDRAMEQVGRAVCDAASNVELADAMGQGVVA